ncbi:hypothetical protein [Xanthomonas translucens]|uniref:Uncharacterized protein n=3 Tax=Xanthomonas campestris pv. translucens TaxID=343 RepID=A0A109HKM2_XANCT|nr:hypothetical protein [Xanthomonas translucens]KWV13962.1 hypothetical protein ATB53_04090 [Xanthomonas translucens]MCC8448600.1 hypothetical protein [Xanthomonas translucens pv. translucens]MCT8285430.1 hypothetical protein [Xanthomonas translucens pv. translucens]MCT8303088.1 hypothetical protein [Xanthomonas translucens pv. translucens]UNU12658.1 hypothetical protein KBV71_08220 [Xanthomonas translucens pv. translucens]
MSASEAIKKINEDFEGAKEHWEEHFDKWTFVHTAPDGRLGPHIVEALAKLGEDNQQIKIGDCGYGEQIAQSFKFAANYRAQQANNAVPFNPGLYQ